MNWRLTSRLTYMGHRSEWRGEPPPFRYPLPTQVDTKCPYVTDNPIVHCKWTISVSMHQMSICSFPNGQKRTDQWTNIFCNSQKAICPSARSYLSILLHSKCTNSRGEQNTVLICIYQRCNLDLKMCLLFQKVFNLLLCTNYYRKTCWTFTFDLITTITKQWCACARGTVGSFKRLKYIKATLH
jgi:hypothetical protein